MKTDYVFKILEQEEWFNREEEYKGSLIDLKDGFIHLSTKNQIYQTCKKHFFGRDNLIVIYFKIKDLEDSLKWEKSRNNDLFPHYYGYIKKKLMIGFCNLRRINNGSHEFPKDFITGKFINK